MFRRERGRVLAVLIRDLGGDFDLAEEALADAVAQAAAVWLTDGLPDNPAAWLLTVARRRGIDRIRRADAGRRALRRLAPTEDDEVAPQEPRPTAIPDERLRLMFTCCHPALSPAARVALTLRTVAGLSEAEIARAFVVSESAMARRLTRARARIRDAGIPYRVPPAHELPDRLGGVLHVIELVFNEAYLAASGDVVVRTDLAEEAIHLARVLVELLPDDAEPQGLLALLLLQHARVDARTDRRGDLVTLEQQDRSRWDHEAIAEGIALVERALRLGRPGRYQLAAAIAALHDGAATWEDTDWPQIVALYRELLARHPSPVVQLNLAVATAMADGPAAGLALLDGLDEALDGYHLLHATRAELHARAGDPASAVTAFDRSLALVTNEAERRHLTRRRAASREQL